MRGCRCCWECVKEFCACALCTCTSRSSKCVSHAHNRTILFPHFNPYLYQIIMKGSERKLCGYGSLLGLKKRTAVLAKTTRNVPDQTKRNRIQHLSKYNDGLKTGCQFSRGTKRFSLLCRVQTDSYAHQSYPMDTGHLFTGAKLLGA
jgi:hypothetical protein